MLLNHPNAQQVRTVCKYHILWLTELMIIQCNYFAQESDILLRLLLFGSGPLANKKLQGSERSILSLSVKNLFFPLTVHLSLPQVFSVSMVEVHGAVPSNFTLKDSSVRLYTTTLFFCQTAMFQTLFGRSQEEKIYKRMNLWLHAQYPYLYVLYLSAFVY